MNSNPFDDLFAVFFDPDADRSWLWNPLHPSAAFCALCAILVMLLATLLTRGG